MGRVEENKKKKKEALFRTAYELFTTKGINSTAISDIVEKAGVAKGTFYLYFKDHPENLSERSGEPGEYQGWR